MMRLIVANLAFNVNAPWNRFQKNIMKYIFYPVLERGLKPLNLQFFKIPILVFISYPNFIIVYL